MDFRKRTYSSQFVPIFPVQQLKRTEEKSDSLKEKDDGYYKKYDGNFVMERRKFPPVPRCRSRFFHIQDVSFRHLLYVLEFCAECIISLLFAGIYHSCLPAAFLLFSGILKCHAEGIPFYGVIYRGAQRNEPKEQADEA